ncbi:MAG: nucleotide-diphospho-sugar transferase [Bacteroidetes bacterium]|nr:nucleotide-diphospho-sugar transferase [Bacteroidota bacterium]
MPSQVPVLFLVFNRPDHTRQSLARIRQAKPPVLYVHCDGPRADRKGELEKVAKVQEIIAEMVDWDCRLHTFYRKENKGLRNGVFEAISWFFEHEPMGIILEDDCLPDPSFFPFCAELLEYYKDDPEIMHIGGSNLAEDFTQSYPASYIFSKFSFVWGWASWARAWERMSFEFSGLPDFPTPDLRAVYMKQKFEVTQQGRNNSWAYAWFYTILNFNGWCIVSKTNLIQNTGVGDRNATNTRGTNQDAKRPAGNMKFPLIHPEQKALVPSFEKKFFYTSQKKRRRLLLWYLLTKIGLR